MYSTLDTGENTSIIRDQEGWKKSKTNLRQVKTPNGSFRSSTEVQVTMRTRNKVKTEALVHERLTSNLLSVAKTVQKLGEILLDKKGEELTPRDKHKEIKTNMKYVATPKNIVSGSNDQR